jgi:hypothetical protein
VGIEDRCLAQCRSGLVAVDLELQPDPPWGLHLGWPIPKHLPPFSVTLGPGLDFDITFTGSSVPGGGFMFVDFKFFDDVQAARAWRRTAVAGAEGNGFPAPRKAIQLERNLVIDWSNGGVPPSRGLNSIVHGCLRTH